MKKDITYHGDVVVFDLDDTLIRERDSCREGFRRIERILTSSPPGAEEDGGLCGDFSGIAARMTEILEERGNYFDYLEERLAAKGIADRLPMLISAYRNNEEAHIGLKPGMDVLLEELSRRGVVMGIVTDGRSLTQRMKIRAAGLERYFDPGNIIISEETGKDKSAPDNFRHFVSRYPEARRFHYIADNERKDFLIPNLLGWSTYRVKWESDNVHEDYRNPDKMSQAASEIDNPAVFAGLIDAKSKP